MNDVYRLFSSMFRKFVKYRLFSSMFRTGMRWRFLTYRREWNEDAGTSNLFWILDWSWILYHATDFGFGFVLDFVWI